MKNNVLEKFVKENEKKEFVKMFSFALDSKKLIPKFIETNSKDYILYGSDNRFPNYLIELAQNSALHSAILKSVTQQVSGKGIKIKDDVNDPKLQAFIDSCNSEGENLFDVIRKCITDYILIGGFTTSNVWTEGGELFEIYHTDVSAIRAGKPDVKGKVNNYFFSNDWTKQNSTFQTLPSFNTENRTGTQIYYYKPYSTGNVVYAEPIYLGMIQWALLDWKVSEFHNANCDNARMPSLFINYNNGIPSPERAEEIFDDLNDEFQGGGKAGKAIINFSNGKETAPDITVLNNNDNDQKFTELSKLILTQILSGWRITSPELVGVKTAGELSSTDLKQAQELFYSTVVDPIKTTVENCFNRLLKQNGFQNEIEIITVQPLSFSIPIDLMKSTLTVNEIRESIDKEKLQGGDVTVTEYEKRPVTPVSDVPPLNTLPTSKSDN